MGHVFVIQVEEMDSVSTKADERSVLETLIKQDYFLFVHKSDSKLCEIINVLGTDERDRSKTDKQKVREFETRAKRFADV